VSTPATAKQNNLSIEDNSDKQGAFATLYDAFGAALYAAISRTLKNECDRKDAFQNTFVRICSYLDSYNAEKEALFTWMLNIAQHEAMDVLRTKYQKQSLGPGTVNDMQFAKGKNPFIHLDRTELHKLLSVLKPMDRAVFELIYFRGYTCEQAAELLRIPCRTVKTKLQSSYRKLQTVLLHSATSRSMTDTFL
jgi:RNA polymerase sigma-70 factor (ECF subfamily)